MMINLFPEVPQNTISNQNEIIFVIDRSGNFIHSETFLKLIFYI